MKKPKTLSANIANLLNSLPQGFDEDDEIDDTSAKVLSADSDESDQGEISERSKIRAQNIDLLEEIDEKYAGKVSNRKNYRDSDADSEIEDADIEDTSDNDRSVEDSGEDEYDDAEANEINSDEESGDESEIEESDLSNGSDVNSEDDVNFKNFTDSTTKDESNRGECVRKQLNIWESLLEIRIKSKKALSASNKLPVGEKFKEVFSNAHEEHKNKLSQTKKNLTSLLDKMITLQNLLLDKYPETKKLLSKTNENKQVEDDDEEITSGDDSVHEQEMKRVKIQDFGKHLTEGHQVYKIYRNKTIEKWYDKTRIKHTASNSHTIVDQINNILMDKSKLLKKSQMKRSSYHIIGETEKQEEEEYNVNIYDDEDFYHQQLRELVEFKSSDITDPLQLSRQWVQLQNMRSKMKRKIDTRATKGRKLRFGVHTKLVNHLSCREYENSKTEDAKNELINSIFQKSN